MSAEQVADQILSLLEKHGDDAYFGEPVSQREHALQAAYLAELEDAPDRLIVAALLHDIGHLLHGDEDIADQGVDAQHETIGDTYLRRWFPEEVTEPARLHVSAKRYLCAADPAYYAALSPASRQSLALQGGPYTPEEVAEFEQNPHFRAAIRLRLWDDAAKVPDGKVPPAEHYRERIVRAVQVVSDGDSPITDR